jgi:hypothetical protein
MDLLRSTKFESDDIEDRDMFVWNDDDVSDSVGELFRTGEDGRGVGSSGNDGEGDVSR